MKAVEKIQAILDKGLNQITIQDQHEITKCIDELYQSKAEKKNKIREEQQLMDNREAELILKLKEEKGEDGKKKYTEIQIKSEISKTMNKAQTDLNILAHDLDYIEGKIKASELYRIDFRDWLKPAVYIQEQ